MTSRRSKASSVSGRPLRVGRSGDDRLGERRHRSGGGGAQRARHRTGPRASARTVSPVAGERRLDEAPTAPGASAAARQEDEHDPGTRRPRRPARRAARGGNGPAGARRPRRRSTRRPRRTPPGGRAPRARRAPAAGPGPSIARRRPRRTRRRRRRARTATRRAGYVAMARSPERGERPVAAFGGRRRPVAGWRDGWVGARPGGGPAIRGRRGARPGQLW